MSAYPKARHLPRNISAAPAHRCATTPGPAPTPPTILPTLTAWFPGHSVINPSLAYTTIHLSDIVILVMHVIDPSRVSETSFVSS